MQQLQNKCACSFGNELPFTILEQSKFAWQGLSIKISYNVCLCHPLFALRFCGEIAQTCPLPNISQAMSPVTASVIQAVLSGADPNLNLFTLVNAKIIKGRK